MNTVTELLDIIRISTSTTTRNSGRIHQKRFKRPSSTSYEGLFYYDDPSIRMAFSLINDDRSNPVCIHIKRERERGAYLHNSHNVHAEWNIIIQKEKKNKRADVDSRIIQREDLLFSYFLMDMTCKIFSWEGDRRNPFMRNNGQGRDNIIIYFFFQILQSRSETGGFDPDRWRS